MQLIQANNMNRAVNKVSWPFADKIRKNFVIFINHCKLTETHTVTPLWVSPTDKDQDIVDMVTDMVTCAC